MKTLDLIDALAAGAGPAPRGLVPRRLGFAALAGLSISAALALALGGLAPVVASMEAPLWIKLAYCGALGLAAAWLAARASRPGAAGGPPWRAVAAVLAVMGAVAAASLSATPEGQRARALMGQSWGSCPWSVLLLSLPVLALMLHAMRRLGPTRLHEAGFAAGLLAGAVGALGYSLACDERSIPFVALWYSLGILATAAAGAAIGPRVLRW